METESADRLGAFGAARWPAPAKINRFLHITGRRADGRHDLQTLFQFLGWGDELSFRVRRDGVIARRGDTVSLAEESDLVLRAAKALRAATGAPYGVDIAVHKRIPMGSGLGGGSSDAATTLIALNALWNCRLDASALAQVGLGLGADVPIFIRGRASWAEGVGEKLTPVAPDEPWVLLAMPDCTVSTAEAF
ncbi:MAG: 4-(cytidine 5'-diphospho)-2-C-methyl-D-erythritol kinase, partial [Algiphilus sp.]